MACSSCSGARRRRNPLAGQHVFRRASDVLLCKQVLASLAASEVRWQRWHWSSKNRRFWWSIPAMVSQEPTPLGGCMDRRDTGTIRANRGSQHFPSLVAWARRDHSAACGCDTPLPRTNRRRDGRSTCAGCALGLLPESRLRYPLHAGASGTLRRQILGRKWHPISAHWHRMPQHHFS